MEENEQAETTDWDLARLAGEGDEAAYEKLISRHQGPIHSFIFRSVGDDETAKDLTQEVFVKAWFALDRVREQARFTTWLFQIAVNLCRDHVKSKAARNDRATQSFASSNPDERLGDREFPHSGAAPDRQTELSEAMKTVDAEIRALPADLRQPFVLGAVEGHSHKEVAAILKISAKAVEVRIYRARRLLTAQLARRGIGPN